MRNKQPLTHRGSILSVAVIVAVGMFALASLTASEEASAQSVTLMIFESQGFQNVLETGDLLVLIRYELPTADWQTAATSPPYMIDATCDDVTDVEDACYTSLTSGTALQTLYDAARATGALRGSRTLPRIANGLSGLYFAAGHGLTFGTTTYEACIEGSATLFATVPTSCMTISWQSSSDLNGNQTVMENILPQVVSNLQEAASAPTNSYVEADKITLMGMIFAREAFSLLNSVVPNAFVASVGAVDFEFSPTVTAGSLETELQTAAQNSDAYLGVQAVSLQLFGVSIHTFGAFTTFIVGAVVIVGLVGFASPQVAAISFLLIGMFGVMMFFVPIQLLFVVLAVLVVLGFQWLYKKLPT